MKVKKIKKLQLYGFNNLTKTLSFNMYDICYAKTPQHRQAYIDYIDEEYNAERLTGILTEVAKIIGANILNIAQQDYEPQGSSVTMLIAEDKEASEALAAEATDSSDHSGMTSRRRKKKRKRKRTRWWRIWTKATSPFILIRRAIPTRASVPSARISTYRPAAGFRR